MKGFKMKISEVIEYLEQQIKYGDVEIYIRDENGTEKPMFWMTRGTYTNQKKVVFGVDEYADK